MMPSSPIAALVLVALFASSSVAHADEWRKDAWMLPKYCQDRVDWSSPASPWHRWHSYFGEAAIHMSHYCRGVHGEIKAKQTVDRAKRSQYIDQALTEMAYVAPSCNERCVLYAELHRRWAWALTEQGKFAEALKHMKLAEASPKPPIAVVPPLGAK